MQVQVHPLVLESTGNTAPRDGLEGKFSVYHGGVVGLLFRKATPAQYEDNVVVDSRVVAVRERIQVQVDGSIRADEFALEPLGRWLLRPGCQIQILNRVSSL